VAESRIRKQRAAVRGALTALIAAATATVLVGTSTVCAPVTLAANAYIMNGTFTPVPDRQFVNMAVDDFVVPAVGGSYAPDERIPLTTPEQAFPFSAANLGIYTVNQSVAAGLRDLQQAMAQQAQEHPGEPYVIFGSRRAR
jgi:hypothetical protein